MCNYKTLFHSESGYAVKCRKCGHLQIAFGTTAMAFTIEQFDEFHRTIEAMMEVHRHAAFRTQKSIQIPTAAKGLSLMYTPTELELLSKMLHSVNEKLGIEKLLSLENSLN